MVSSDINSLLQCALLFGTAIEMADESIDHLRNSQKVHGNHLVSIAFSSMLLNILNLKLTHGLAHPDCDHCSGDTEGMAKLNNDSADEYPRHSPVKLKQNETAEHSHKCCSHDHTKEAVSCEEKQSSQHSHSHCDDNLHERHNHNHCSHDHKHSHKEEKTEVSCQTEDFETGVIEQAGSKEEFASVSGKSNVRAMVLHLMFDIAASATVLFSSLMVRYFQVYFFDSICCLFISAVIVVSGLPLFWNSIRQVFVVPFDFKLLFGDSILIDYNELNKRCIRLLQGSKTVLYLEIETPLQRLVTAEKEERFCRVYGLERLTFNLS